MGDSKGHFTNGLAFCVVGLWHLFNLLKQQLQDSPSFPSFPIWYRPLELLFIAAASSLSFSMELFTGSFRHLPLDADGSFVPSHLPHLEHAVIALSIFVYASSSLLLHRLSPTTSMIHPLSSSLAAVAFALELLLFRFHSTDHMGLEGHYHCLLQLVISASLAATLLGVAFPNSFPIGFVRSISLLFQGVWFINIGLMLWTPSLIPYGCFLNTEEDGHTAAVRCRTVEALQRAKGIATLQFAYYVLGIVSLAVTTHLRVTVKAHGHGQYRSVSSRSDGGDDVELERACDLVG